tara:strand:+ start:162 stop:353 length:192 start_codon:yes stop_codon:yes gene_type:complete
MFFDYIFFTAFSAFVGWLVGYFFDRFNLVIVKGESTAKAFAVIAFGVAVLTLLFDGLPDSWLL